MGAQDGGHLRSRAAILEDLSREEARLAQLERDCRESQARVEALRSELEGVSARRLALVEDRAEVPSTPEDKIALFRSLFRGRPDVFPTRFVARRTGKAGYAPACTNKFQPGLCALKTGGKCGDCANQAFVPVTDRTILDHLQGRHVMGLYPLLEDETCWLLAADFDKHSWQEDVAAFAETCRATGLPVAVERSRSGRGAHAWFFFSAPVSAKIARAMGSHLITETASRRHELAMSSYDRLFPNQDTLPRGGFGNLIAMPLQHGPRQAGNSVFVDPWERFEPFPDQWAYLANITRIDSIRAEEIAREAKRAGRVIGVLSPEGTDESASPAPWKRIPSGRSPAPQSRSPLPERVYAVLAQRLFIQKPGLPAPILNELKRLAAFQNPEFYKKQKMRLSTALTPRVIACAEDLPKHIALPRGCQAKAEALLAERGATLMVEDKRQEDEALAETAFRGELTPLQKEAASALLAQDYGVFVAPPGVGKTVLGTYLISARRCSTLILVHRKPLLEQWIAQIAIFLGMNDKEIGRIGGGKRKPNGRLDVAMVQSLVRRGEVDDDIAHYGQVIVDECHHIPALSFEQVLSEAKARFFVGFTATPQRRDGHHPITDMQLGPVRSRVTSKSQAARRPFEHKLIIRETKFRMQEGADATFQDICRALAEDDTRNALIFNDVVAAIEEGRSPVILTERKDHLGHLAERLRRVVRHVVVLRGGMKARERHDALAELASLPARTERVIVATGRYIGEGFDDARLDTLFLAMPISWKGTLVQYSGRLHRHHPDKREVRIYDYVDRDVPLLFKMFEKRLPTYRAIGYARGEAPLGFADLTEGPRIEYDDEALRHFDEED